MTNQFLRAAKKVDRAKRQMKDEVEDSFKGGVESTADEMKRQLRIHDTVATSNLLRSITAVPNPPKGPAYTSMQIVGANYWKYVEFGTGIYTGRGYSAASPMANYGKIMQWVIARGITPDPRGPYDTQSEVAWAIARSLTTGTESQPFARPAIRGPRGRSGITNRIASAMEYTFERNM